jgi:acyl transferase domain-containing protein/NAD(P)H-dependent flavin oxidoreductase YrpB (nitropropane dioxygenase family)
VLLEVTTPDQLKELTAISPEIVGLVAKGYESGGWVSNDSAYILTQKLVQSCSLPVYVHGGIGLHTAAACRAAGAAGVVLDDQLLLMPESFLPEDKKQLIRQLNGQETVVVGERIGKGLRVLARRGFNSVAKLQQQADQLEIAGGDFETWQQVATPMVGWGDPQHLAWPVGQAVGLAAHYQEKYRTTGRFIQALVNNAADQLQRCIQTPPLGPENDLAQAHNTQYPIVQGPMTRVSDTVDFASAVAQAGGLPVLALALMRKPQVDTLLKEAQAKLGDRSWGVGLLGFAPQNLRRDQIDVVKAVRPPFAIIAGGRPDQAAQLEAEGIATYIHVPTANLLQIFLAQGARRFIFEGAECGGHIGPLSSFVLWESMAQVLLHQVPTSQAHEIHILFAGGIHDRLSAAMVSAMAMPLVQHGIKVGVLMGTAYLFTQEAVACGAIVDGFQQQALNCHQTIALETGPGHASRCAVTPFAKEFYDTRREMLAAGRDPEDIKLVLEELTLGRLRVASKGIQRSTTGDLESVDLVNQAQSGMYMIGQVATLRQQTCTIAELHQDVAVGSVQYFSAWTPDQQHHTPLSSPSDIAIVGIGTILPKADHPQQFWQNILEKVNAIGEIPAHRWDWQLYYSTDRQDQNKVYSKWGGFIDPIPFDPLRYGIPPNSIKSIEPAQLLVLETVRRALEDAGYDKTSEFDREHTSVILGASGGSADLGQQYSTRSELARAVVNPDPEVWERLPEWTEESFPGILMNVAAGRVANRLDLGGANFTVDAACASSLAAIDIAVQELEHGRCAMALAGGLDAVQSPFSYFCFSKTQALSPQGVARSFDRQADGIVISEGFAVVVLKRLADAERDGDRIYGVIKAVSSSSDGKGLGLTAPASQGQLRALRRAYAKAGFSPATLGLYEAHGTGTVAGDRAELQTIGTLLQQEQAVANACAIGSVKTLIGHTKSAAGVVAMVKAVLALYHQTLPPHTNVEHPLEGIEGDTPTYLLKEARPWFQPPHHPRRAAVSAFGFGGTNFHAVLEEYSGNGMPAPVGASAWPCELLLFPAQTREDLLATVEKLSADLAAGAEPKLADLAYSLTHSFVAQAVAVPGLALVVQNLAQLEEALATVKTYLSQLPTDPLPPHIQIHPALMGQAPADESIATGKVAFLFPGQGAQYANMAREMALYFPEFRQAIEVASDIVDHPLGKPLHQYMYPPAVFSAQDEASIHQDLTRTQIAQPAIGAISAGFLQTAQRLGLQADMVAGHSYGEYTALYAAGVINQSDFFRLSQIRGQAMGDTLGHTDGAMAAVMADRETVLNYLSTEAEVVLANHNAPQQSVISGPRPAVKRIVERCQANHLSAQILPVAGAFHSPLVQPARAIIAATLAEVDMRPPAIPVYSNLTARPYEPDTLRPWLAEQLTGAVEFVRQINAMYADGARFFIELGPKRVLTKLIRQILGQRPYVSVSLDSPLGLEGMLHSLAQLAMAGISLDWLQLYQGRPVQALNLSKLVAATKPAPPTPSTWWIDGGSARRPGEQAGHFGRQPLLTQARIAALETTKPHSHQQSPEQEVAMSSLSSSQPERESQPIPHTGSSDHQLPRSNSSHCPMSDSSYQPSSYRPPSASETSLLSAYQSYQETMRHFLAVQESVMGQFLHTLGHSNGSALPTVYPPSPTRMLGVPTGANGHNGNGHTAHNSSPAVPPGSTFDAAEPATAPDQPAVVQPPVTIAGTPAIASSTANTEVIEAPSLPEEASTSPAHKAMDRPAMTELLLELVSDRTGYPTDMLGLDQDMEADLGIDSIKRVEIFGALQKQLPPSFAAVVQSQMETFTQVKTLNGLVDQLLVKADADPDSPSQIGAERQEEQRLGKFDSAAPVPRYVMQGTPKDLTGTSQSALAGTVLITQDQGSVATQLCQLLQQHGVRAIIIGGSVLRDLQQLTAAVERLRDQYSPIAGIIHLAGLTTTGLSRRLSSWRRQAQLTSKSLFYLLQLCAGDLQKTQAKVISASMLGGYFGRNGTCGPGSPLAGSSSGLLKTMMLEWPGVRAKAVDFDPAISNEKLAQVLLDELVTTDQHPEVGYAKGKRIVFEPVCLQRSNPEAKAELVIRSDWVIVAIGGARGITAEVLRGFVKPGMRLILVGRSPLPEEEEEAIRGIDEISELRRHFVQGALTRGEKPTPAQIEAQLQRLQRQRAIRHNLAHFQAAGIKVDYQAIDVRSETALGGYCQIYMPSMAVLMLSFRGLASLRTN